MEDIDKFIIKYFLGPLVTIIAIASIISSIDTGTKVPDYIWTTSEELQQQYRDQDNEWYNKRGIDNTYHGLKSHAHTNYRKNENNNPENAEPGSDLFREYMEELDDRGIEIGSPEATEIWDTYYK
jgi:hypothetical protein